MNNYQSLNILRSFGSLPKTYIQYLLKDTFSANLAAGSVNGTQADIGGARTVTDTNSKLSISSGGLQFATGGAATYDPRLMYQSVTRVAGRMLLWNKSGTAGALRIGFGPDATSVNQAGFNITTITIALMDSGSGASIGAITSGTVYAYCAVLRSTGVYLFVKGGTEYPKWTLLWRGTLGNSTPVFPGIAGESTTAVGTVTNFRIPTNLFLPTPLAYDTFTRANGALGSTETTGPDSQGVGALAWTGSTWTINSNVATNTPTLGSEAITNGTFSTDTTGWTASGSSLASVAGGNPGNCLQVTNSGAAAGYAYQALTTVVGQWYSVSCDLKNGLASGRINIGTTQGGTENNSKSLSTASFANRLLSFRATATTTYISLVVGTSAASDTALFDNVSVKPLTTAELFATLATSTKDVIIDSNLTFGNESQQGVVLNLDSVSAPANYVVAYLDSRNGTVTAKLDKCVAGVFTSIISASVTYSAGATLRVIKDGTSYQLFYNNAKVGSTSTISDVGIIANVLHGHFSPAPGGTTAQTFDNFLLMPRGTSNEYNALDQY